MKSFGREGGVFFPCALLLFFIAACSVIAVRQISGSLAGKISQAQGAGNWHAAPQNSIMSDFWWMQSLKGTKLSLDSVSNSTFGRHRQISFDNVYETGNQTIKRLWIDVGVHEQSDFITNLDEDPDLFLMGFEPSTKWKPCTHDRCVVLWAAATPDYDIVSLNLQDGNDLCNSLLKPNNETKTKLWRGCVTQLTNADGSKKVIEVPGVPLHELVQRIPDGIVVEYVKIDAQGYDLQVMKGLLPTSKRVQVVSLEAMDVDDKEKLLYHGQPPLSEMIEYLADVGWTYVKSFKHAANRNDENAYFVSDPRYASKVDRLAKGLVPVQGRREITSKKL